MSSVLRNSRGRGADFTKHGFFSGAYSAHLVGSIRAEFIADERTNWHFGSYEHWDRGRRPVNRLVCIFSVL